MARKIIEIQAEYAPKDFFGRFDLRLNRLMTDLAQRGLIDDATAAAFGRAIGRRGSTVARWLDYESFPNSVSLTKIAVEFEISINWIVGLQGNNIADAYLSSRPAAHRKAKMKKERQAA
jgi:hypothetical protein